jgi:hypothetical protein
VAAVEAGSASGFREAVAGRPVKTPGSNLGFHSKESIMLLGARYLTKAGVASLALVALTLMLVAPASSTLAQDQNQGQGQGGGGRGRGGPGGGNFDPESFRQRINERMKEVMGASDDEWMVIQPKVEKVMALQRQTAGGRGMGMLFGRGGPGGGRGPGGPGGGGAPGGGDPNAQGGGGRRGGGGPFGGQDDNSPVAQASRDLQKAVESNASDDEFKAKLAALRDARAKAKAELTAAQKELRELITVKQEAALVMMGMLE